MAVWGSHLASGNYLETASSTWFQPGRTITVMFWARPASIPNNANYWSVVGTTNASSVSGWAVSVQGGGSGNAWWEAFFTNNGSNYDDFRFTTTVAIDRWDHVAWVLRSDNTEVAYLNAVQETLVQASNAGTYPTAASRPFRIRYGDTTGNGTFDGGTAYVRIFDGELSAAEIRAEMMSRRAVNKRVPVIADYPLESLGGGSIVAPDVGPRGLHVTTVNGTVTWGIEPPLPPLPQSPVLLLARTLDAPAGGDVVAQTGDTSAGASTSGTAVKVAAVTALCAAGALALGAAHKVTPSAGLTCAGAASTAAAVKVTAQTGRAAGGAASSTAVVKVAAPLSNTPAGGTSTGSMTRTAVETGTTSAGASSAGTAVKHTAQTGLDAAGASTTGGAVKVAPQTGVDAAGAASSTSVSRTAVQTGAATAGATSSATTTKTVTGITGNTSGGASSAGGAVKHTAQTGLTAGGGSSSATVSSADAIPETGAAAAGAATWASVTKTATPTGAAAAGAATSATAVRVASTTGWCVLGATSSGSPVKRATPTGPAAAGSSSSTTAVKRAVVSGLGAAGATSTSAGSGTHTSGGQTAGGASTSGGAGRVVAASGATFGGASTAGTVTIPQPAASSRLYAAAAAIVACVNTALADTPSGQPNRACVVPGALAWDECDCGLLAVTAGRIYPSRSFPVDASGDSYQDQCPLPYVAADLTVHVVRCAPNPDEFANAPTCAALHASAVQWRADAAAVRSALACCLPQLVDEGTIEVWALRDLTPNGPQGGCVGLEQRLTVGLCTPSC